MEYYEYGALAETEKGVPYIIGQAAGDLNILAMTILSGEGTLFSAFPNADGEIYARVTGIAGISSSCDRVKEAELFVDFLLDERWQKNFNGTGTSVLSGLPARKMCIRDRNKDEITTIAIFSDTRQGDEDVILRALSGGFDTDGCIRR